MSGMVYWNHKTYCGDSCAVTSCQKNLEWQFEILPSVTVLNFHFRTSLFAPRRTERQVKSICKVCKSTLEVASRIIFRLICIYNIFITSHVTLLWWQGTDNLLTVKLKIARCLICINCLFFFLFYLVTIVDQNYLSHVLYIFFVYLTKLLWLRTRLRSSEAWRFASLSAFESVIWGMARIIWKYAKATASRYVGYLSFLLVSTIRVNMC